MPYRSDIKDKFPLFYVHISYFNPKKNNVPSTSCDWLRAKDSFKALQILMKKCGVTEKDVWAQDVITEQDFIEKELGIE